MLTPILLYKSGMLGGINHTDVTCYPDVDIIGVMGLHIFLIYIQDEKLHISSGTRQYTN